MYKTLAAVLCLLLFYGCKSHDAKAVNETAFETLHSGSYLESGEGTQKQTVLFTTQDDYESTLETYSSEAAFEIDFDAERVVLIDMGQRSSGGYAVRVGSVAAYDDYVDVNVTYTLPGSNCAVTMALTNPYLFVRLYTTKEVLFSEQVEVTECSGFETESNATKKAI